MCSPNLLVAARRVAKYKTLVAPTRFEVAEGRHVRTVLLATEISFLLGFDQPSSFYRAFRTWTGATPESVRHEREILG